MSKEICSIYTEFLFESGVFLSGHEVWARESQQGNAIICHFTFPPTSTQLLQVFF